MSAQIVDVSNGVLTVKITGKLAQAELAAIQKSAAKTIQQHGKIRVLTIAEKFEGWERAGDWGDLSVQMAIDPHIEKMAIVGDKKWEDLALVFAAKGLRKFPIEYFSPSDEGKARAWLLQECPDKRS
jgi:hypothetical protein